MGSRFTVYVRSLGEKNAFASCSLSGMYARCVMLNCTRKSFYQVDVPDLVSWNSVIGAFSFGCSADEAIQFFSEMRLLGLEPDELLFDACFVLFVIVLSLKPTLKV
ncbi:Pentatricopeptide repeat-containing protein [Dendrobium catenatum]|uniref:Pentatricopeptide repeat-containing protein n=1 Tax=Dendrobium catenatum TaxID=906689 RepID=A0A2I0WAL2_9ASPA|nr:Pentatricopeptide repeat-containing protein [Dendrobium catenatum]